MHMSAMASPGLQPAGPQGAGQPVDLGVEVGVGAVPVRGDQRQAVGDPGRPPGVQHALGRRGALVLGDAHGALRSAGRAEQRQLPAVAQRLPGDRHGHAAVDVGRRAADDVGHHAHPLLQVDQGDAVGLPAGERRPGRLGPVLDDGGVHRGPPAGLAPLAAGARRGAAVRAERPRVEDAPVAGRAPLHEQAALAGGLPERPALVAHRAARSAARVPRSARPARHRVASVPSTAVDMTERNMPEPWATATSAPVDLALRRPRPGAGAPPR